MLDRAAAGGYALAAVNVTSSETLNAALRGLAEAEADGIVQYTPAAAEYISGAAVRNVRTWLPIPASQKTGLKRSSAAARNPAGAPNRRLPRYQVATKARTDPAAPAD